MASKLTHRHSEILFIYNSFKLCISRDYYLTSAGWVTDSNRQVSVVYMMRSQNYSIIATCFADLNWECAEVSISELVLLLY